MTKILKDMVKDMNIMQMKNKFALLYNVQHFDMTIIAIENISSEHIRILAISHIFATYINNIYPYNIP